MRQQNDSEWSIDSVAVHAGEGTYRTDATATTTPIFMTSSFHYESSDDLDAVFGNDAPGFVYSRYGNPTTRAFESAIARLEETEDAVAFSSGMAAIYAAIALHVCAGDTVLASQDVYGASYAVLRDHFRKLGVNPVFVDITDLDTVGNAVQVHKPKVILAETISNPLLRVADVAGIVELASSVDARVLIDNTFATPLLTHPVELGAALSIHSSTKFISGHGDTTGGVLAGSAEIVAQLREQSKLLGAIPSPMDSWLSLRGLKTLPLRFSRQCDSAHQLAARLGDDERIARVIYPSEVGATQQQFRSEHRGAMISFEVRDAGQKEIFRFMDALQMVVPATTLGDVYSLVLYPAMSSHRALTPEERTRVGISDNLVRLSIGIESPDDIFNDISCALDQAMSER